MESKVDLNNALIINSRKIINKITAYKYPETSDGWVKYEHNPVIGDKKSGSLFDPMIVEHNGRLFMFVSNRNKNGIVLYKSPDGILWSNPVDILMSDNPEVHINRAHVVHTPVNNWNIYYTFQRGNHSCIKMISSPDISRYDIRDSIICIDGSDRKHCVMNPCVMWDIFENNYKMWFSSGDIYEPDVICYAESRDGIKWDIAQNPVLTKDRNEKYRRFKVGGCHVVRNPKGYYDMYYIGYQSMDISAICHAYSSDGIKWIQNKGNPIVAASGKGWDGDSIYKPTFLQRNEKQYLWYNGRKGKDEYIGLATKEDHYDR